MCVCGGGGGGGGLVVTTDKRLNCLIIDEINGGDQLLVHSVFECGAWLCLGLIPEFKAHHSLMNIVPSSFLKTAGK